MRRRTILRLLGSMGALLGLVWVAASAAFTDTATASSSFSAGTVDLVAGGDADDDYSFTTLSTSDMKPGQVTYAALTIANAGTLEYSYTMASSSTGTDLKEELQLAAKVVTGACDATSYAASATTAVAAGDIDDAAISSARTLAAEASETLCFKVELPSGVANTLQGTTTDTTFTFTATNT